jgi:hypothetical protein
MFRLNVFRSKVLSVGLVAVFLLLTVPRPAPAQTTTSSSQGGALQGTVYSEGMRMRVSNAIVKIRNLNTGKEYISLPTDAKGSYRIIQIDEGWYTMGVTTAAGDFNLNYGVYIKAGETAKLSVEMLPGGQLEGKGNGGGVSKKGFFATPAGILLIVAAAGGAGFGIYELTKSEGERSPIR